MIKATRLVLICTMFIIGTVSLSLGEESRWMRLTQYWGQIKSIRVDRCGHRPGLCEGSLVLGRREKGDVILAIRPGTWIKRGERLVLIEELQVGDEIHVQAFEIEGQRRLQATEIEITTPR